LSAITFVQEFANRLVEIESRAKAVGSNMTQVCKSTGIARPTFERWAQRAPQTIVKLDELEAYVARLELAFAAKASATQPDAAPSGEAEKPANDGAASE
jgi:hypothetical protein